MNYCIDHVSVLVDSVERTAGLFADSGVAIGKKEQFSDVGTEEIYVGDFEMQALLLLQAAVTDGVYKRALLKRGTGIHHIAICTDDFESFNEKLAGLGWLVHPNSLRNYKKGKTVFYVKPGVGTILELITKKKVLSGDSFITEVMINVEKGRENCINGIGLKGLKCSTAEEGYLVINGRKWQVKDM